MSVMKRNDCEFVLIDQDCVFFESQNCDELNLNWVEYYLTVKYYFSNLWVSKTRKWISFHHKLMLISWFQDGILVNLSNPSPDSRCLSISTTLSMFVRLMICSSISFDHSKLSRSRIARTSSPSFTQSCGYLDNFDVAQFKQLFCRLFPMSRNTSE